MANTSKFEGKTDEQLLELKKACTEQANYCFQQQNQFWGSGAHDTAGTFEESAASFAKQSEEIDEELKSRKQANLSKEEKKALEEQPTYPDPTLAPADQPTPATQPEEPSTKQQQEVQGHNKSSNNK